MYIRMHLFVMESFQLPVICLLVSEKLSIIAYFHIIHIVRQIPKNFNNFKLRNSYENLFKVKRLIRSRLKA